jgi:hypothetical protein
MRLVVYSQMNEPSGDARNTFEGRFFDIAVTAKF